MKEAKIAKKPHLSTRAPLWQKLIIILLVIAMPLFFAFVRNNQMQRALINTAPEPQNSQPTPTSPANNQTKV